MCAPESSSVERMCRLGNGASWRFQDTECEVYYKLLQPIKISSGDTLDLQLGFVSDSIVRASAEASSETGNLVDVDQKVRTCESMCQFPTVTYTVKINGSKYGGGTLEKL